MQNRTVMKCGEQKVSNFENVKLRKNHLDQAVLAFLVLRVFQLYHMLPPKTSDEPNRDE